MIAMVSNMSVLQFAGSDLDFRADLARRENRDLTPSRIAKCNWCAVLSFIVFLPISAAAQASSTGQTLQAPPEEHRALDSVKFLAGAGLGLVMHESGHLVFDAAFDASPRITGVRFGPFPFFAITHRGDLSPRREFTISSAGFWMQDLSSEWLLTRRPGLRHTHAPAAKGVLAFNVLNSAGYASVAFARAGPFERDTRGMADTSGVDERAIGALILAPAVLDAIRYFKPDARWAKWASRAAKAGSVLLVAKRR
jgi:hypothetical protein